MPHISYPIFYPFQRDALISWVRIRGKDCLAIGLLTFDHSACSLLGLFDIRFPWGFAVEEILLICFVPDRNDCFCLLHNIPSNSFRGFSLGVFCLCVRLAQSFVLTSPSLWFHTLHRLGFDFGASFGFGFLHRSPWRCCHLDTLLCFGLILDLALSFLGTLLSLCN